MAAGAIVHKHTLVLSCGGGASSSISCSRVFERLLLLLHLAMSPELRDESSAAAAILNTVLDNFKNLPPSSSSSSSSSSSLPRLFGRQKPVHQLLGGGHSADVLLWRKKHLSAGFLGTSTLVWFLFEWIEYHLLSLLSLVLLLALVTLFVWSNAAAFFNRPPPRIPKLQLSDEFVLKLARTLKMEINKMLASFYEIAMGRDVKEFAKLFGGLSLLVLFGSWFNFLTLCYLAIVAVHTLPVLYEKNEDAIDRLAMNVVKEAKRQYKKIDETLLSKIPRGPSKQKRSD